MKSTTAHEDQFAPEPTPQEEEAWRELEVRQSTVKESLTPEQPVSGADGLQVDINDVRQYLDSWGCMEHPGVRAVVGAYQPQPSGNAEWESAAKAQGLDEASGLTRWNPLPGGGMNPHPSGMYVRFEDVAQPSGNALTERAQELEIESALSELVDKIVPGLDTGDLVADAATASKALDAQPSGNSGQLDELAAFERELLKRIPNARLNRTHDGYLNESYEFAWRMWQARAALTAQASAETAIRDDLHLSLILDMYDNAMQKAFEGREFSNPCVAGTWEAKAWDEGKKEGKQKRDAGLPHSIAAQASAEPRLNKPAKVGHARFGVGVKWSTVIGAAQRRYENEVTPEKEAERIASGREKLAEFHQQAAQDTGQYTAADVTEAHTSGCELGLCQRTSQDMEDAERYRWIAKQKDAWAVLGDEYNLASEYEGANNLTEAIDHARAAAKEQS